MIDPVFGLDRRSGIGASQCPALLNLSAYSSPLGEYLYYTGALPDQPPSEPMLLGTDLEPGICNAAARLLGVEISKPATRRHPQLPWMFASPDGEIDPTHGFEAKHVGPRNAEAWGPAGGDEVPDQVIVQTHHQMEVFGYLKVTVAALVMGEVRLYKVQRNRNIISRLLAVEYEFWQRVQRRDPPPPDWTHPATVGLLEAMHPPKGGSVLLSEDDQFHASMYAEAVANTTVAEKVKAKAKAHLLHALGDASEGILPDGRKIVRAVVERKGFTVEPTSYVSFSIRQPRKDRVR